jgi:hypothetical protein
MGRGKGKYKRSGAKCKRLKKRIAGAHGKRQRGKALAAWARKCR